MAIMRFEYLKYILFERSDTKFTSTSPGNPIESEAKYEFKRGDERGSRLQMLDHFFLGRNG